MAWKTLKTACPPAPAYKIRTAFLCGGADMSPWPGGWTPGVHDGADLERTLEAFDTALTLLEEDGSYA